MYFAVEREEKKKSILLLMSFDRNGLLIASHAFDVILLGEIHFRKTNQQ
jgi:hypothetical protein